MRFKIIAVDQAAFDQWAASMTVAPGQMAAAVSGDVAKTPDAFGICIGCHRVSGTNAVAAPQGLEQTALTDSGGPGAAKIAGPDLTSYACRTTIGAGTMPNDVEHLREWLYDPGSVKPGNYMATVIQAGTLDVPTADDTDDPNRTNLDVIVDYLIALQPEGGCAPILAESEDVVTLAGSAGAPTAEEASS
jgi:cytochrome c2